MSLPTYFISHGGGPWPYTKDQMPGVWDNLEASLKELPRGLPEPPKAILAVSGHWEEKDFTVMASPHPPMVYDYTGFPEHTYHIKYPAPGSPVVAQRMRSLLGQAGFEAALDTQRGYDQGVFVPFAVVYPNAGLPILQLSIRTDYDPEIHWPPGAL